MIVSGILAGAGGAYLSLGLGSAFTENMTAGRGFIALAALIFGRLAAVRRSGGVPAVRLLERPRRQPAGVLDVDLDLFTALPYLLTLVAVAGVIGRTIPPAADGIPYKKQ